MSDETNWIDAQADVQRRITNFVSNYSKTPKDRFNLGYITVRATGLNDLWKEFMHNHKQIVSESTPETRKKDDYFVSDTFAKYEEIYFDILGRITQKHIDLTPTPPDINGASTSQQANQNVGNIIPPANIAPQANIYQAQIPRLNVPTFSGSYEDWTSFHDIYNAAVHMNHSIQPVHKLQYLKSLLKGDAEFLLKNTPITTENYELAWKALKERFENKRALLTTTLRQLFGQSHAEETAIGIRKLLDTSRECTEALKIQGIDIASWDCILVYIISQHIPPTSLTLWEQSIPRNEIPTYEQLLKFLEDRFRVLEFSYIQSDTNRQASSGRSRARQQSFHTVATNCRCCQGSQHSLKVCLKFLDMQPPQRLTYITNAKLCKNCFAYSHPTQNCKSSGKCNVCSQRHHTLLHLTPKPSAAGPSTAHNSSVTTGRSPSTNESARDQTSSYVALPSASSSTDCILATALITVTAFDGQQHSFRALLDNGSQENFVSKQVLQFLGVKPQPTSVIISGVGQSQAPRPLGQVRFCFGSKYDPSFSMEVNAIVLPMLTQTLPTRSLVVNPQLIADLELADPHYGTPGRIDVLLSASVFASITIPCLRKESSIATIALQTRLGWVMYGEAVAKTDQNRSCFHVTTLDQISTVLQDFWKVEEVPSSNTLSPDDEKCERIYAETHTRQKDGRYTVQIPFIHEPPVLGSSRERAVTRFLQIERKLAADPVLRSEYSKCINEYLILGHMRPISSQEKHQSISLPDKTQTYTSYYLPHHAVVKAESTTTKVRVVFDASSKTQNGKSLNESMLTGPVLQDHLFNIMLRWRSHRIVIKADIEKMYRQIRVTEKHQDYQRIVWRDQTDQEIQDFQLQTVTFGTAAAPYLAIKTIFQLANDEQEYFPIGAAILRTDFYVDDLLSGADTVEEAIMNQHQVINILQRGGFQIRKWSSNSDAVTSQIDETARELCSASDPKLKALGILWNPQTDYLSIKVSPTSSKIDTKRTLLSEISKLFDPLGWIAPTIICMKILLQKLWLAGLTWDETLPSAILSEWYEFQRNLPSIENIQIQRWIQTSPNTPIELHGFCDASEKAYAAVVYVRVQTSESEWILHLITAKTRVAPVKTISLPRLELCGAVLLAKLIVSIRDTLKASKIYTWTDSEIVLAWLQGHPNRWKTFVGNRISEIHNTIDAAVWNHVSSKDNPADCASRGIPPDQLSDHQLWWHGPEWLIKDETKWPIKCRKDITPTTLEIRTLKQSFVTIPSINPLNHVLNKCGELRKAILVVAYVRKWRSRKTLIAPDLTVKELTLANNALVKYTQTSEFSEEYKQLLSKLPLSKKNKLISLNPFLDEESIIRVGGRLQNAEIPMAARHPIILPHKSPFTNLLIDDAHLKTFHGGVSLTLSFLRTQYWILDGRNAVRYRIHKCNLCYRFSNPSLKQLMGNLPKPRVNKSDPFTHTGLDYAGPLSILLRRRAGRPIMTKGYICVFVCLATKAIHLELVGDMSAQTFLAAFDRFTSRRGLPSDMYSDNGTYFARASLDIDQEMKNAQQKYPKEAATHALFKGIKWHFIPPAAPHFGGLWEAGVKSTKYHLKRILGEGTCTYEELLTILCQIESCLNSRPLCPISNDPDDFEILTPGHFLIGRPLISRPQPGILEVPTNRLSYWKRIYQTTQRFWKQWQTEYLSRLQQRPKWVSKTTNIEKGDLVLLKEDNIPPSQWRLGRILDTHQGTDGLTRVVTIKTPTNILKRPIVKVCPLPNQ